MRRDPGWILPVGGRESRVDTERNGRIACSLARSLSRLSLVGDLCRGSERPERDSTEMKMEMKMKNRVTVVTRPRGTGRLDEGRWEKKPPVPQKGGK